MANKTISGLNSGAPGQASDALPIQRGSSNYKLTLSAIAAFVGANGPNIAAKTIPANLTGSNAPALPATLPAIINALQPTGVKWYVDHINGNDENTGTSEFNAFATLAHAQDAANNGDVIYLNDGFTLTNNFVVSKELTFYSQGEVFLNGGISIGSYSSRWTGVFNFRSTNLPAMAFYGPGEHYFDEARVYSTYNSSATDTIVSAIFISNGPSVSFNELSSISLETQSNQFTRATHIYMTGGLPSSLVIADSRHDLRRSKNSVKYNIFYSDATSIYNSAKLNNIKIDEFNSGQNDSTVNDLFSGGNGYGHNIFISTVSYVSRNEKLGNSKIRIANSDQGLFRCAILVKNIMIQPAFLENGDILLSNATTSGDFCSVTDCTILNNFTLPVSGAGVNIYEYYDSLGNHYSSKAPNEAFVLVIGALPITNNALRGRIQVQGITLGAGNFMNFRLNNSNVTPNTHVTFSPITTGVNGVNIIMVGNDPSSGYVQIFIQNMGTVNHSGFIVLDYEIRTNYVDAV